MGFPNQIANPRVFGYYKSSPRPFSFWGTSGWYTVPAGHSWNIYTDKNFNVWVSPNPITVAADGTPSADPLYAAELNFDGTLVFQNALASRALLIDSPPPTWLSC